MTASICRRSYVLIPPPLPANADLACMTNPAAFINIGTVEVVVLRCKPDGTRVLTPRPAPGDILTGSPFPHKSAMKSSHSASPMSVNSSTTEDDILSPGFLRLFDGTGDEPITSELYSEASRILDVKADSTDDTSKTTPDILRMSFPPARNDPNAASLCAERKLRAERRPAAHPQFTEGWHASPSPDNYSSRVLAHPFMAAPFPPPSQAPPTYPIPSPPNGDHKGVAVSVPANVQHNFLRQAAMQGSTYPGVFQTTEWIIDLSLSDADLADAINDPEANLQKASDNQTSSLLIFASELARYIKALEGIAKK